MRYVNSHGSLPRCFLSACGGGSRCGLGTGAAAVLPFVAVARQGMGWCLVLGVLWPVLGRRRRVDVFRRVALVISDRSDGETKQSKETNRWRWTWSCRPCDGRPRPGRPSRPARFIVCRVGVEATGEERWQEHSRCYTMVHSIPPNLPPSPTCPGGGHSPTAETRESGLQASLSSETPTVHLCAVAEMERKARVRHRWRRYKKAAFHPLHPCFSITLA